MHLSKWRNFVITFLIFLAIYQTVELWFENLSNHSFFYLLKNQSDQSNIPRQFSYSAESIFITTGNNKFIKKYNGMSSSDYTKIFDEAIYLSVKNGDFSHIENFDIKTVFDRKSIIYSYSYSITGEDMIKIFNYNNNIAKVDIFDTLILIPSLTETENITTIFFDSKGLNAYIFQVNKDILSSNINSIISELTYTDNKEFYFISSEKSGITLFATNQFLPKPIEDYFYIYDIVATNPLEKDGGILLSESENYVDIFFENPVMKFSSFINNTYTYNDENTVIKYYTTGILEYAYYGSIKNNGSDKNESPYSVALEFLKRDINIKNKYYLKGYEILDDKITLYFDYKINGFPIILSESQREITGMDSMIEITIENNKVSKYKRLVYDFDVQGDFTVVENSFIGAIDNVISRINETENRDLGKIYKMELAYEFNDLNEIMDAKWFINIDDDVYFEEIK